MNYIRRSIDGIEISDNGIRQLDVSLIQYLNQLAFLGLREVKSIQVIIKRKFGIKTNIPIVINREIALVLTKSIRDFDCILVNAQEIYQISDQSETSKITFFDGSNIEVKMSYSLLRKRLKQVRDIVKKISL